MAEATKKTETITVTKVTLILDEAEARTLRAILGHVAGDEVDSPRKHADAIAAALTKAGFASPVGTAEGKLIQKFDPTGHAVMGVRFANYGNSAYMTRNDIRRADGYRPTRAWGAI
jgi:hypothetical protein